eukprot:CAMPEP_0194098730 /NCGR_PEP_ID=MMETSP0150-20130528/41_1 /TAXON_ID=122233 /ORGANISM="Chaetoceros debilis, Strain MM31A-1" /LENGTH=716 /DNA_ID=CAMNT_0038784801 /DNA_START=80 /DNA_END=2226 /DNA_ORIENTATION=-
MNFFNVAMALALVLAPNTAFATKESNIFNATTSDDYQPTFSHQDVTEETTSTASSEGTRYLVKYNNNSSKYNARIETARIQAQAKKQGGEDLNGAVPSFSADTHLLTHGRFLPNQNVEIVYFNSEKEKALFEQSEEVEYIEEDHKIYLNGEEIPYGIEKVQALPVSDDNVSNRKVCIIDTGYDINHPDLTSDTAIVTGYSGSNSAGPSPWTFDGHGHGTHVAGTIAAIGGNDEGVVGVNRNGQLKLYIVKVFGDSGTWGWKSSLIAAVEECVKAKANVISMSLGGGGFSQTESNTYDRILNTDDILLVAAAGNGGKNAVESYPASYNSVMSVAATDSNDNVANFSQENDQVDIAAPGVSIRSTLPSHVAASGYSAWSGTSMATPHVSGVAALVWSHHTTKSAVEIREALEVSAVDMGATGRDDAYGHGLLRADLAMEFLGGSPSISPSPTDAPSVSFSDRPSLISSSPTGTPTISSSPTMESDYEDHQVTVGPSNGQKSKAVDLPFDNMLGFPQPINRSEFSSSTQFTAEVEGKILTITKTSNSGSWSQNFIARLVKVADSSSWKKFRVGPSENVGSNSNPFFVDLPEEDMRVIPYPCNSMLAWWGDTFDVEVTGKRLKVTRTDKDGTWGMNLKFFIASGRGTQSSPSSSPTSNPTMSPSFGSTPSTKAPAASLSSNPSQIPTKSISVPPSSRPTRRPTASPSRNPTVSPSRNPTV